MGPSGAGKTSLLNILSGFKSNGVTGTITINGQRRDKKEFRQKSSYIPQEFAMLPKLTVEETMRIAADLKLDRNVSHVMKQSLVGDIIKMLKLEKCRNTYVDRLSGGERKRLSIGTELIINPPFMFFDEPTR